MNKLRNKILTWGTVILLFAGVGCEDQDTAFPSQEEGRGRDASLTLAIGENLSRAAKDGDSMKKLVVLLVDVNSEIVGRDISTPDAVSQTVTFTGLLRGQYTLYIIANAPGDLDLSTAAYEVGATLPGTLKDRLLVTLSGTDTPSYDDTDGMPLTLVKEVALSPGANQISAELERVVGRFSVSVYNHIDNKKLCISNVELSDFNASIGYLFNHNNTIPGAVTYRSFPPLTDIISIASHGSASVFDKYLYENIASTYEMTIEGAIFEESDNPATCVINQNIGSNQTSINSPDDVYVIRSYSDNTYYLYTNGSTLSVKQPADDNELINDKNYQWQFSGTSSGTMKNVGTDRYITISGSKLYIGTTGSNFNFGASTGIYFRSGTTGRRYFINRNGGGINTTNRTSDTPNDNNSRWYLRPYTETEEWKDAGGNTLTPVKNFSVTTPINYINSFGATAALKYIYRNEHLHTTANVFYNEGQGTFNFEVVPWEKKTADITFD